MGRKKIIIKQIPDVKLRHITFNKRKNGLFKKAAELSVLCNLNLLLVCEDGLGNLIRFSKNKITDVNSFISQCNYQNVIDLTSDDYPDFAKINRKKDKDEAESACEEEQVQTKGKSTKTAVRMNPQSKGATKSRKKSSSSSQSREDSEEYHNSIWPKRVKLSNPPSSAQKKNKNKLNLRLKIPNAEGGNESQNLIQSESSVKLSSTNAETHNNFSERNIKQNDYVPIRPLEKNVDFVSPPFMPYMDLKRLGSMYDATTSPFKFYSQNARMDPINTVLKGLSPFRFPLAGTPLMPKTNMGDNEEKMLDSSSARKFMNRMGPETGNSTASHKVFTFQPEDSNIPIMNTRNDGNMGNQRFIPNQGPLQGHMQEYVNLPSTTKSELEFDIGIPQEMLSARQFNFEGYFKDFDDGGFNELRKKYKLT